MPELGIGGIVGLYFAARYNLDAGGSAVLAVVVALLAYAASCWIWPYRKCPRCGGDDRAFDKRGNYRHKRPCWWCRGARDNPRIGAMLIGRAKRGG